ncbi:MAG: hypothetical protein INH13_25745 [Cupriavidus sp.]|nr:hypothetical protein [Cupriavidus sp.]
MPRFFTVTYDVTTPESAEHGDSAEYGFVLPGNWKEPMPNKIPREELTMRLRDAVQLCFPQWDAGRWWEESDAMREDYRTGAVERRAIHPPRNITPASYARITRALQCKS